MLLWNDPSSAVVARFGIAGDFLPASGLKPVGAQTWSEMARPLVDAFGELDFALVNLESPVNVGSLPPRTKPSLGDTFNAPQEALDYLRALKCKVVSLANNHTYDYDSSGVATTEGALKAAGIVPLGISQNLEEPPSVHVLNLGDNARIGIWCSALGLRECATKKSAGLEPATIERGKAALSLLKSQGATCCVAFLHAGAEGTNRPDPGAVTLMDSLAREGFDLVAACHSHRTSGFADVVRQSSPYPAFCFYGLGSLSSGVIYSELEREGLLALIGLNSEGRIASVEAKPIYLAGPGWGTIPTREQAESILSNFLAVSREILDGSYEHGFYSDAGRHFLQAQWRDLSLAFNRAGLRGVLSKVGRLRMGHLRTLFHSNLRSG
jgi:Bacterial capsule synthesis protein PGA_cap